MRILRYVLLLSVVMFGSSLTAHADFSIDFEGDAANTAAGFTSFVMTNGDSVTDAMQTIIDSNGDSLTVSIGAANLPDGDPDFRVVTRNGSNADVWNDWIGVDTRTGGTDVTMTITISGLAAGQYNWASYHEDGGTGTTNGNLNGEFDYTLTGGDPGAGVITVSEGNATGGTTGGIFNTTFTADGSDVVFSMVMDAGQGGTSNALFAFVGGLEVTAVPEPSSAFVLLSLAGIGFVRRRR